MTGEVMNANSWFPCYPSDLIGDTTHLNNHDFGAYWRLLCWYYCKGPPPNDDETLRQIMRVEKTEWIRTKGNVMAFFELNGDGSWHQKRADQIIVERDELSRIAREKSLKGVEARREKGLLPPKPQVEPVVEPKVEPGVLPKVVPKVVPQGTTSSRTQPQPQPHPQLQVQPQPQRVSGRFAPPTLEEVKLNGAKMGLPETECVKFHSYYESNGWRVGKNGMKSWRAAMIHWRETVRERGVPEKSKIAPERIRSMSDQIQRIGDSV